MRSGTSFFDGTVFKKNITRFWPLWAAYFVLWLIILPLQGVTAIRMARIYAGSGIRDYHHVESFANHIVPGSVETALFLALVFGVLAAMAVFSHLYSTRSANLFGSLPIRREGLFLTHYLAGLCFLIVPNVLTFLLTWVVEGLGGCVNLAGLLFWLGAACGECFFFYSLAVFCGMFTGHLLALPAFYTVINIFTYGIVGILYMVLNTFYFGFAGFGGWVETLVKALTPVAGLNEWVGYSWAQEAWPDDAAENVISSAQEVLTFYGTGVVAAYALAGLALTACAFLLYRARRLESAGDVVSVRPMKPVFKYGVAFCAGGVFGYGATMFLGGGERMLMVSVLIWGVIGYFAAQMLLDKSFRVFKKWKGAMAVVGVFAVLFLVVGLDLTGYETRVPDAADVQSVYVRGLSTVNYNDDGDRAYVDVDGPDQIALLTAFHRAAVDQRDWDRMTLRDSFTTSAWVKLTYTLKNGSTMSRDYYVVIDPADIDREGTTAWAVERLHHTPEFYWKVYGFDRLEEEIALGRRLDSVEFVHYRDDWGSVSDAFGYGDDARAVLDAVEEDLLAGRIGVRTLTDPRLTKGGEPMDSLRFRVVNTSNMDTVLWVEIALQDTASSTLAELNRLEKNMNNQSIRDAFEEWLK